MVFKPYDCDVSVPVNRNCISVMKSELCKI